MSETTKEEKTQFLTWMTIEGWLLMKVPYPCT